MKPGSVFYKMSGSGNDFLVFDGRYVDLADFTPQGIHALCDRRQGAGADGVIVLAPEEGNGAHFRFHFWNQDGSAGPMCGNGALCATRISTLLELAPSDGDEVRFVTPAGLHKGRVVDGLPQIELPDCQPPQPASRVAVEPSEQHPFLVNPSVPHLVTLVDDVEDVDVGRRGPILRNDPATGEGGANANWLAPVGDGTFRMRTWERGVEGETLACGTGAVACAIVLNHLRLAKPPIRIWTRSGLPLTVGLKAGPAQITALTLTGEGRVVYRGIVGEAPSHKIP